MLGRTIVIGLRRQSMAVDLAVSGDAAERMCGVTEYDVLVLDRDLPVLSGDEVCRRVRGMAAPPRILMLTAAGGVEDRVYGLERLGADDYLAKPFDFAELVARIRALSRRVLKAPPVVVAYEGITVDAARREARIDGRAVELTPKEFAVLHALVGAGGEAVTQAELVRSVWDEHLDPRTSAVRATVSRLRGKLGPPDVIVADAGEGYRLCR